MTAIDPPVCVALDVPTLEEAARVVADLEGLITLFKIGPILFYEFGPAAIDLVQRTGARVFLDLKVHDIPRTAAGAVAGASRLGVTFLTIHGSGGRDMIRAAVESARENGDVRVLTVTVLTSLDDASLSSIGVHASVLEQARRLGIVAAEEGSDGLVASPRELSVLRASVPNLFLATPGVRTPEDPPDDQRRVMTAGEAVLEGSDLIVVGRPVLKAPNLRFSVQRIVNEVARAGARHEARRAHDLNDSSALVDDVEFVADDRPRGV